MNIWSIVVIVLYTLNLGVVLAKHGQQGKYNFWASLLNFGIIMFCLYMGGFFK